MPAKKITTSEAPKDEVYHVELRGKNLTENLVEAQIGRLIRKMGAISSSKARREEIRLREIYLPSSLRRGELETLRRLPAPF